MNLKWDVPLDITNSWLSSLEQSLVWLDWQIGPCTNVLSVLSFFFSSLPSVESSCEHSTDISPSIGMAYLLRNSHLFIHPTDTEQHYNLFGVMFLATNPNIHSLLALVWSLPHPDLAPVSLCSGRVQCPRQMKETVVKPYLIMGHVFPCFRVQVTNGEKIFWSFSRYWARAQQPAATEQAEM